MEIAEHTDLLSKAITYEKANAAYFFYFFTFSWLGSRLGGFESAGDTIHLTT